MKTSFSSALAALILATSAGASSACPQYLDAVEAVQGSDTEAAAALWEEISVEPLCDDAFRAWVGSYLARAAFLEAMEAADADTKRALLEAALGYERHWRSFAELGRLAWDEGDYAHAGRQLQLAINELIEGPEAHEATEQEIAEVYQLASAALALADEPVEMPRTRSGEAGGLLAGSIRGFEVTEVPLPITFEFNSTEFDPIGSAYAGMLADHIAMTAPEAIVLGGHTDPVGSETFNLDLSKARAEALAVFLRDRGFEGEILTVGHGESMLPEPPPGIVPGSDEHYRIARRVVFSEG